MYMTIHSKLMKYMNDQFKVMKLTKIKKKTLNKYK